MVVFSLQEFKHFSYFSQRNGMSHIIAIQSEFGEIVNVVLGSVLKPYWVPTWNTFDIIERYSKYITRTLFMIYEIPDNF